MASGPIRQAGKVELRLGELAVQANLTTEAEIKRALEIQSKEKKSGRLPRQLGVILLALEILSERDLMFLLAQQDRMRREASQGIDLETRLPAAGNDKGPAR